MRNDHLAAGSGGAWKHWIVLCAVFVARLGFSALVYERPELALANDSDRYVPIANAILSGDAYRWNTDRPGELLNTVGYPLFLAAVFATLGREPGDVALAQLIISGLAALLAYAVLATWLGQKAGLVTALVLLLEPLTILWSMTVLTETLFAFTLCISALAMVAWAFSRKWQLLLLSGTLVGIACLVRPVALAILAAWAVAVFFLADPAEAARPARLRAGVRRLLLFVLPAAILLVPWVVRNTLLWNCPSLSPVDRVTMRDYIAAKIMVETEGVPLEVAQGRLQAEDPGVCPRQSAKYQQLILENAGTYLRLHVAGTIPILISTNFDRWLQFAGMDYTLPDLWRPYMAGGVRGLAVVLGEELAELPQGLGLMLVLTILQLGLYAMAGLGVIAAFRTASVPQRWYAATLLVSLLVLLVTPGQGGHERFRVPMQPLLAILAGCWVAWGFVARRISNEVPSGGIDR